MSASVICHFLIGVPGSGKSTFAAKLAQLGNYRIISTDTIRQQLYGDATIQGEWREIEAQVITQICATITSGNGVIYDATNAQRGWRTELLMKLNSSLVETLGDWEKLSPPPVWMAWYLQTPLKTCLQWNKQRDRIVPDIVIEKMYNCLQDFSPLAAEGFAAVKQIDVTSPKLNLSHLDTQIKQLQRSIINRTNRTLHSQITLHSYSKLLDFDRLMHLISLIIRYPGIGNLQCTDKTLLESIFGTIPEFATSLEEITAFMHKFYGSIYADIQAISADLHWLQQQGLIAQNSHTPLPSPNPEIPYATHPYSDLETFTRLVQIIRFILHHPFLPNQGGGSLKTLIAALQENGIIKGDGLDTVRKDIEKVLKPYKILPKFPLRDGYFAGTAILSPQELIKVFDVLQSQAKSLDDPVALDIYETFRERITLSKLGVSQAYPVRAIANRCMIDPEFVPAAALSRNLHQLEEAIANAELLELNRFKGGGKFTGDEQGFFLAYPLQIVFCNVAWYLGFECIGGEYGGLFRFERLDRLFRGKPQHQWRTREEQEKSLQKLQKLHSASAGLFLGYSASEQKLFLSTDKKEQLQASVKVELWFDDDRFRFIVEGTKRFPAKQMKMSAPVYGGKVRLTQSIFCLQKTGDERFPNRFCVVLPKWSLNDVEFVKWVVGFGGNVKVVQPLELVEKVRGIGKGIVGVYEE